VCDGRQQPDGLATRHPRAAAIAVLLIASARHRTIVRATFVLVTVEGALITMWALVSHGTITW
jgi:hypothetical protein